LKNRLSSGKLKAFKPLLQRLFHYFASQHIYEYAIVAPAECLEDASRHEV
jgi:hypothetical protein